MPAPRLFAAPARWLRLLVYGPHPIGRYNAASVDRATTATLGGRGRGLRYGEQSSVGWKFSGDLGPMQDMRGGAFVGRSTNLRKSGEDRALPNTSAAAGNPVMAQLGAIMPTSENDR